MFNPFPRQYFIHLECPHWALNIWYYYIVKKFQLYLKTPINGVFTNKELVTRII